MGGGVQQSTGGQGGRPEAGGFTFRKEETRVCGSQSRGVWRIQARGRSLQKEREVGAGARAEGKVDIEAGGCC